MKTFNTVDDMKLAHLVAGQRVQTLGYFDIKDSGHATYLIVANQPVDSYGDHDLASGTVACLQYNGPPNVLQFGAVPDGFNETDTESFEAAYAAAIARFGVTAFVFVPAGKYLIFGTVVGSFFSFGAVTINIGTVDTLYDLTVVLESQIVDANILARIASDEAITGHWSVPATPNIQNGNYTLVLTDAGRTLHKTTDVISITHTIPADSSVPYLKGTMIAWQNEGIADMMIAINDDTLTGNDGISGTKVLGPNHTAVVEKTKDTSWKYSASDA